MGTEIYFLLGITLIITIWFWAVNHFTAKSIQKIAESNMPEEAKNNAMWSSEWFVRIQFILMVSNALIVLWVCYGDKL